MHQYQLSSLESYTDLLRRGGWRKTLDGRVLHAVCAIAPCTRREVAEFLDIQASTISGAVNRLLKVGTLITEQSNPGDRPCKVSGRHTNLLGKHPSLVTP